MANSVFGIRLENRRMSWLIIGGLGAVLGAVLLLDDGGAEDAESVSAQTGAAEASGTTGDSTTAGAAGVAPTGASRPIRKIRKWPHIDPAEVLAHNPFSFSEEAAEELALQTRVEEVIPPTEEELQTIERQRRVGQTLDELRRTRVSAIFRTSSGNAAVVGSRTLHEGDVVDGVRIVSITNQGIIVEPSAAP